MTAQLTQDNPTKQKKHLKIVHPELIVSHPVSSSNGPLVLFSAPTFGEAQHGERSVRERAGVPASIQNLENRAQEISTKDT